MNSKKALIIGGLTALGASLIGGLAYLYYFRKKVNFEKLTNK